MLIEQAEEKVLCFAYFLKFKLETYKYYALSVPLCKKHNTAQYIVKLCYTILATTLKKITNNRPKVQHT